MNDDAQRHRTDRDIDTTVLDEQGERDEAVNETAIDDHITDETPAVGAEPEVERRLEKEPGQGPEHEDGRAARTSDASRLVRRSARRRDRVPTAGGSTLHLLVLSSTLEDTTVADLPRHVGTLRGRHVRKLLRRMVATPDGPLLGFPGASAPYWEFRGFRPSVALIEPTRSPQLIRRRADGSTWVRFGWDREDVWLPVEDRHAARALDAARRERLSGKSLASALGFEPQYLLVTVSPPRDGHCYKDCAAVLPRG